MIELILFVLAYVFVMLAVFYFCVSAGKHTEDAFIIAVFWPLVLILTILWVPFHLVLKSAKRKRGW